MDESPSGAVPGGFWGAGGGCGLKKRDALTQREREVLRLVGRGCRDKEIAVELCLSIHTVRAHVRNARGKMGASSRAQAVLIAFR